MDWLPSGYLINDRFRIVEPLGQGGMGAVYRGEQLPLGRAVALKLMRNDIPKNLRTPHEQRFFREANLCANLSHPNIVTIYDYGKFEEGDETSTYYLAMEFLNGQTLAERIDKQGGPLPTMEVIEMALQVARGLRYAHKRGIIHRDLKPENIMLVLEDGERDQVKIVDFGLVKNIEGSEQLTSAGSLLGSPFYMSPEQGSTGPLDHRTDLYSLGVVLYKCLCGHLPFQGKTAMQILLGHASQTPPKLHERNPDCEVPPELEALVYRLLEKSPNARIQSTHELILALQRIRENLSHPSQNNGLWSTEIVSRSIWVLTEDPIFSRAPLPEVLQRLKTINSKVLEISTEKCTELSHKLKQGELSPPWVVLFSDLQVILENPLLGALRRWGECSKILISKHLNAEMLQRGINFCGLDYHVCLPDTVERILESIELVLVYSHDIRQRHNSVGLPQKAPGVSEERHK